MVNLFKSGMFAGHLSGCWLVCAWVLAQSAENPGRKTMELEGWTVHVSQDLLQQEPEATKKALQLLARQLREINQVVPKPAVEELRRVPLWISPEYPNVQPRAEYHPGAGWLRDNQRDPAMEKGVEFTNVRIFEQETLRMPNFALHELAHAYHDRVLPEGFSNPAIRHAFEQALADGLYEKVEQRFGDGRSATVRAYALTNPQEYFAECTEAYFSTNDFFPFNREQLIQYDPRMFQVLSELWGAPAPATETTATGVARFLIVGKGKIADPESMQQRAIEAVDRVSQAARSLKMPSNVTPVTDPARSSAPTDGRATGKSDVEIEALAERVLTVPQFRQGVKEKVTGAVFRDRMRQLAEASTPMDTVVIYTHSHGYRNGFESSQPSGGLVFDLPVRQPEHAGALLWPEFAELILNIPARNVVVLTMSCFSGALVDELNSDKFRSQWENRRSDHGRNLIILTSQNEQLVSQPILINKQRINPFTWAVGQALEGEADGFVLEKDDPLKDAARDGKLSVGELVDYVLYTTEHTRSGDPRFANTARPMCTGSFRREDILFEWNAASVNPGEQASPRR